MADDRRARCTMTIRGGRYSIMIRRRGSEHGENVLRRSLWHGSCPLAARSRPTLLIRGELRPAAQPIAPKCAAPRRRGYAEVEAWGMRRSCPKKRQNTHFGFSGGDALTAVRRVLCSIRGRGLGD